MTTILVTGFGPFPGAPFNPTRPLVKHLARLRRPALANANIVTHVFETSYAAVDRDLPALLEKHRPDALLMFGLATRARTLRIETRARNALALLPDANGAALRRAVIAHGGPIARMMPSPSRRLQTAARTAGVPVILSRDAGRYLCNYLCWRAAETSGRRLAAFIHVPLVRRCARPIKRTSAAFFSVRPRESGDPGAKELDSRLRGNERRLMQSHATQSKHAITAIGLFRAGERLLVAINSAVNRA